MSKALTIVGLVVSGLLGLVFTLDLVAGIPFGGANLVMDIGMLFAALALGYTSWDAMREIR
ncbi:hypothetical protein OAS39_12455 [Pirellulales bacterium]|nr:hypothetical protein [Pirellulales bacterium]